MAQRVVRGRLLNLSPRQSVELSCNNSVFVLYTPASTTKTTRARNISFAVHALENEMHACAGYFLHAFYVHEYGNEWE